MNLSNDCVKFGRQSPLMFERHKKTFCTHVGGSRRRLHFDKAEIKGLERGPEGSRGEDNSLAVCLYAWVLA